MYPTNSTHCEIMDSLDSSGINGVELCACEASHASVLFFVPGLIPDQIIAYTGIEIGLLVI